MIPPDTNNKRLHVHYLWVQVNVNQLPSETAGNHYLRRFVPASEVNFTYGTVYLRPPQDILHAPFLQCNRRCAWDTRTLCNLVKLLIYSMNIIYLPRKVKFWKEDFGKNEIADLYQLVRNILTTFAEVIHVYQTSVENCQARETRFVLSPSEDNLVE